MAGVVLDTTVLVDVLRTRASALEFVAGLNQRPICSEITRTEIIRGLFEDELDRAEEVFRRIRWIGIDEQLARRAGELGRRWRPSHGGIGVGDLVVAATAEALAAELATSNVRHFPMFPNLEPPY